MNRQDIINRTMKRLAKINTISVDQLVDKIKKGTVPEASVPRTLFTFAERNNYNGAERKEFMRYLIKEEVHKISDKHKQGMEYLRDKMFKISAAELAID